MQIKFYDRHSGQIQTEKVMAGNSLEWLYSSWIAKPLLPLLTKRFISRLSGWYQNRPSSVKGIPAFISNYNIQMNDFVREKEEGEGYSHFNSFFIRRYKDGLRPFVQDSKIMPAFCEARYFGVEKVTPEMTFPVKGQYLKAQDLLGNSKWSSTFEGGPLMIARLCPVDYHWFHFPDDGKVLGQYTIPGAYHSVSPLALAHKPEVFCVNERQVSILETKNFGKLAYIEVGALCVGRIVQTYQSENFKRGEAKGHFLFGGSTVIVLGEKGAWRPADDILFYSEKRMETLLRLGVSAAFSCS